MKKGQKVRVIDNERTYHTHPDHKMLGCSKFIYAESPENNSIGVVLQYNEYHKSVAIDVDGVHYLIGLTGVDLIKEEEIHTTKERILEAASKCEQAKATLKTLFPEVFEDDKYFDLRKAPKKLDSYNIYVNAETAQGDDFVLLCVRSNGRFADKSFYLSGCCNWDIIKDEQDSLCLIPTKKQ